MEKIKLKSGLELSRLIYGMWRLGDDADTSPAHVQRKIEACLEQGVTSFDQADIYGDYGSEQILGAALKDAPHLRQHMQIITKCDIMLLSEKYPERRVKHYDTSRDHILASVDQSLKNMAIDHIDLLLIHRPDPFMDHCETGAALDELVKSGKVSSVGVSNFKLHDWTLLQSGMNTPLVTNQVEASLLHSDPFTNGDIAFMQERDIPPMIWSPLGGGRLARDTESDLGQALVRIAGEYGVAPTDVAIAWLLAHPARLMPIMGTNTLERIKRISQALDVKLDRETWFELYTLANGHEVP